ncbi:hypothetical protein [Nocardioides insulae]|uniref:hypothetical protein n=1 Tax=Nocardioides insulae TaxID=394734 RepID=UPI00040027A5|nr:hypothetical protein [Nocardioides insulae]
MLSVDVVPPDSVTELAEHLRRDPVIIEQRLGSGDTAGSDRRITASADQLPFAVYVAVVAPPPEISPGTGAGDELAIALSREIGEPGLYVVGSEFGVRSRLIGVEGMDPDLFSLHAYANQEAVTSATEPDTRLHTVVDAEIVVRTATHTIDDDYSEPNLPATEVEELARRNDELRPYETARRARSHGDDDQPPEPWTTGKRWMVGSLTGVLALLLLWHLLSGRPRLRRPRATGSARPSSARTPSAPRSVSAARTTPDRDAERERSSALLTALAEDLAAYSDRGADPTSAERLQAAVLAREVAEPLLDSGDVLDLVGAGVLARIGRREVSRARGRARTPYRPCFFDPRHPSGTRKAEWRFGDATVEVPVCPRCLQALERDRWPDPLTPPSGRPYYDGDTVWARTGFGALTDDLAGAVARAREGRR